MRPMHHKGSHLASCSHQHNCQLIGISHPQILIKQKSKAPRALQQKLCLIGAPLEPCSPTYSTFICNLYAQPIFHICPCIATISVGAKHMALPTCYCHLSMEDCRTTNQTYVTNCLHKTCMLIGIQGKFEITSNVFIVVHMVRGSKPQASSCTRSTLVV